MKRKDELLEMCKELDKKSMGSTENPIVLAREAVVEYVNNDRDKYLQLKAEVESIPGTIESKNYLFSTLSFEMAAFALMLSCVSICTKSDNELFVVSMLVAFIIILLYAMHVSKIFSLMTSWKKYILAVFYEFKMDETPEEKDK